MEIQAREIRTTTEYGDFIRPGCFAQFYTVVGRTMLKLTSVPAVKKDHVTFSNSLTFLHELKPMKC